MKRKSVAFFENGSWYHRTKVLLEDGRTKYGKKGGFKTIEEAEKSHSLYEERFKKAVRDYQIANKVDKEILLKDYLIYWFEEIYSKRTVSTTQYLGAYTLYHLLLPNIDYDIKLRYTSAEYLDALLLKVSTITSSAANKSRKFLNVALKDAVVDGFISSNPITMTKSYNPHEPKIIILNKEYIKLLLSTSYDTNWYLEILLALFCGLRKGEILGLKFSDFDTERKTVRISRQLVLHFTFGKDGKVLSRQLIERDPKTLKSFRTLRVPDVILEELNKRKNKIDIYKEKNKDIFIDNDYISCRTNGLPHSISAMNIALTRICVRSGLPQISVHSLRHMFATILLEQGVSLIKISGLLGHTSINTTFEFYCDVMDENEKIVDFMNQQFEDIFLEGK